MSDDIDRLANTVRDALSMPYIAAGGTKKHGDGLRALDALTERAKQAEAERDQAREMDAGTTEVLKDALAEVERLSDALRALTAAVTHYVEFEPEWNVGEPEWTPESTGTWMRIEEILDACLAAARVALAGKETPDAR